ncbi:MAG: bacillithiol biosynthesis deacetylase BshB1 [Chloroherpetonaceae bacterium]|nr:bacillithiol biosynthesis deacetylase BshB1 [Chloroherpetonaceae bacterium]MDW8020830.1 bacillithiol biosynthesis deacetylase BshB1 [Chloroherpetonaceae bacterium]
MTEPIYALAFGAHPDDVEISCAATMLKLHREGKSVVVCDLTEGEMGTRGSRKQRRKEAHAAAQILGYRERINLNLGDTRFLNSRENLLKLIAVIRRYRPTVVFAPQPVERHPDHERAAKLVADACFYAGLLKIKTKESGKVQARHRPKFLFHYLQDRFTLPSFIVDVSETFEESRQGVLAFKSQFFNPASKEPETHISRKEFLESLEARAKYFGELIGARYGEGFLYGNILPVRCFSAVFA